MITLQIGDGPVMKQGDVTEGWINQQIRRRREDGQSVCVKVTISNSTVDMLLATPGCTNIGRSRQIPTPEEKLILELWTACGLNQESFTAGNLLAFLSQLEQLR